ncbi:MAG: hypothetical protein WEA99_06020 [Brumimicrobium sp.]
MKIIPLFLLIITTTFSSAQNKPVYDSILAKELGADEYGMKSYSFVILTTGDSTINDQKRVQELFNGHLKNISELEKDGKLVLAGPLGENPHEYRGLFIFNNPSVEETKKLLNTDPAIVAGLLNYKIFEWYGSAALPTYLETHYRIQKTSF